MTQILMIAYYFPPTGGAGVQRAQKFAQYLPSEGYLPTVITAPALPPSRWTPTDQTLMKSIPSEVSVHPVKVPMPNEGGRVRRGLESWFGRSGVFAKWWVREATATGLRINRGEQLIFATMAPFESGIVARDLSQRLGMPWVADLRDPWALDEMQVYPTWFHRRLDVRRMERLLESATLIIMNTPEAAAVLQGACPRLRNKEVISITNGFDQEDFPPPAPARRDGKFRIVHSGYLHTGNGLLLRKKHLRRTLGGAEPGVDILTRSHSVLLEAVDRWCCRRPRVRADVELVFAGQISEEDRALAERSPVAKLVRFAGYLPHGDSVKLVRTADLLFLPMHNLPPGKRSRIVPGKTYEYIASGRPILAAVPAGDAQDFLAAAGTAHLCRPDDASAMVRILDRVYDGWLKGTTLAGPDQMYIRQFERRRLTSDLAKAFDRTLNLDSQRPEAAAQRSA